MALQKQIEGVRQHSVVSQVAPSIRWTAEEATARQAIKAAFTGKNTSQWEIGDQLNIIAPSKGRGVDNPEGRAKLVAIAEENHVSLASVQYYRQVAARYNKVERVNFRTFREALDALKAENRGEQDPKAKNPPTLTEYLDSALYALNQIPSGEALTAEQRNTVSVIHLAAKMLLGEE